MTNPMDDDRGAAAESMAQAARALPREVEPPAELWTGVQAEIARRQVVHAIGGQRAPEAPGTGSRATMVTIGVPRWTLQVAASLVLFAAGTLLVLNMRGPSGSEPRQEITAVTPVKATPAQAAAMIATLDQYDAAAKDLSAALAAKRSQLRPATVAAVEQSLRTIDTAIGEARAALEKDPASGAVYDLLLGMYRQKIELLKRSAALAAS